MIDTVFSEMIHRLSGFTVLELQDIRAVWTAELERNHVGTGMKRLCLIMRDEIITCKQQKQVAV